MTPFKSAERLVISWAGKREFSPRTPFNCEATSDTGTRNWTNFGMNSISLHQIPFSFHMAPKLHHFFLNVLAYWLKDGVLKEGWNEFKSSKCAVLTSHVFHMYSIILLDSVPVSYPLRIIHPSLHNSGLNYLYIDGSNSCDFFQPVFSLLIMFWDTDKRCP